MNDFEWETRLRQAKPGDDEIAPLDPARASAILSRALAQNARSRNGGAMMPLFLLPTWRVAVGAVACLTAAVGFGMVDWQGRDITDQSQTVAPVYVERMAHVANPLPNPLVTPAVFQGEGQKALAGGKVLPRRKTSAPRTYRPQPIVKPMTLPSSTPSTMLASHVRKTVPRLDTTPAPSLPAPAPRTEAEEGPLFVAASGVRDDDSGELHVTVTENVPPSVPGRAEAATVQTVQPVAAPNNAALMPASDFWAYAKIESGRQPELTLTALR